MLEARLRVEVKSSIKGNPFYGDTTSTNVIENILTMTKRENIKNPPCGICGRMQFDCVGGEMELSFKVDKLYFDYFENNWTSCHFSHDGEVYELCAFYEGEKLSCVEVNRWFCLDDYEDGRDPDKTYTKDDTDLTYEPYN